MKLEFSIPLLRFSRFTSLAMNSYGPNAPSWPPQNFGQGGQPQGFPNAASQMPATNQNSFSTFDGSLGGSKPNKPDKDGKAGKGKDEKSAKAGKGESSPASQPAALVNWLFSFLPGAAAEDDGRSAGKGSAFKSIPLNLSIQR